MDYTDVHVTSRSQVVDCFTQYPLLDGTKNYAVQLTEFNCPVNLGPMQTNFDGVGYDYLFELRRKNVGVAPNHQDSLLTTLPYGVGANHTAAASVSEHLPVNLFTTDLTQFKIGNLRPVENIGDLAYHIQRFFNDAIGRYLSVKEVADKNVAIQQAIVDDGGSSAAQIAAAQLLLNGPGGDDGLTALAAFYTQAVDGNDVVKPIIHAAIHGRGNDVTISAASRFVTVVLEGNSQLRLYFSPIFNEHFFLVVTEYAQKILGLTEIIAFRAGAAQIVKVSKDALMDGTNLIVEGTVADTVEIRSIELERFFDRRIRLDVETQMGVQPTIIWSTDNQQKVSHVIATFPFSKKKSVKYVCDSEGTLLEQIAYSQDVIRGNITFRKAEDMVNERYKLLNPKFFHNIRLEVFITLKNWEFDAAQNKSRFVFRREKISLLDDQTWTGKLRFLSI